MEVCNKTTNIQSLMSFETGLRPKWAKNITFLSVIKLKKRPDFRNSFKHQIGIICHLRSLEAIFDCNPQKVIKLIEGRGFLMV